MDSSVSPKDEIWFLRVFHHISTGLYLWRELWEVDKVATVQTAFSVQQTIISLHVFNTFSSLSLLIFAEICLAFSPCLSLPAHNNSTVAPADVIIQHFVLFCFFLCEIWRGIQLMCSEETIITQLVFLRVQDWVLYRGPKDFVTFDRFSNGNEI